MTTMWGYRNTANTSQNKAKQDKKKIYKFWWRANDAAVKLEAFNTWTETEFSIPVAESGDECTVRGYRKDYLFERPNETFQHQYDFVAYFLNGDCDGSEEVTITIKKNANFWNKNLYYDDEDNILTEVTDSPGDATKERSFILRPDGTFAAFRISKGNKWLKPKYPYNTVEINDVGAGEE